MRYLLDTNVLGDLLGNRSSVLSEKVEQAMGTGDCAISVLTRAETRFGLALMRLKDPRRPHIEKLLDALPTFDCTSAAADCYGQMKADLKGEGQPIGEIDMQLAAHALSLQLVLVTRNLRHFEHCRRWIAIANLFRRFRRLSAVRQRTDQASAFDSARPLFR